MKKTFLKNIAIGSVMSVSCIGLIGVAIATMLVLCVFVSGVAILDEMDTTEAQPTGVPFFESTGGWDYSRIALIEPYVVVSVDNKTWSLGVEVDDPDPTRDLTQVYPTKLDVINNRFIILYSSNAILNGERVDELWFVIIPEENVETGFTKEEEFLAYLEDRGIDNPNLTDVNELYEELVNKGYLEWFPEEYKE